MDGAIAVGYLGGGYAFALASSVLVRRGQTPLAAKLFGALLATGGAAVLAITLDHAFDAPAAVRDFELILALLVGPLLLAWTRANGDPAFRLGAAHLAHLVPPLAAAAMAVALDVAADRWIVACQLPYTIAAIAVNRRFRGRAPRWCSVLLLGFLAVHAAQIVRTILGSSVAGAVPVTGTLALLAVTVAALRSSMLPRAPYERSALNASDAEAAAQRLERALADERIYTNHELTLSQAASLAGVSPQVLSQALNQFHGRSFAELLKEHRLNHAARELESPASGDLKIEAIAFRAGFASRSSFHEAFRKRFGVTPSRYREQRLGPAR